MAKLEFKDGKLVAAVKVATAPSRETAVPKAEAGTPCKVSGCPHPVKLLKHGLCWGHYKRYLKNGTPGGLLRPLKHHPPAVV